MDDLRTIIDQLEDKRLAYVMARSKVNSDRQAYIEAGINKAIFYRWSVEERDKLNDIAQRVKRETALRALIVLQNAAEEAANVKAQGLKSRDERVKQGAATEILDRTVGKPLQKEEVNTSGDVNIHIIYDNKIVNQPDA